MCLFLLPILVLVLGFTLHDSEPQPAIIVGVHVPENSPIAEQTWANLQQHNSEQMLFKKAAKVSELKNMVISGKWNSGYIFTSDFEEKVARNNYFRIIQSVYAPSTSNRTLSNWAFAAALLEACSPDVANHFLQNGGLGQNISDSELNQFMAEHFSHELLMELEVKTAGVPNPTLSSTSALTSASLTRGITALMLLLFSCLCAVIFKNDLGSGFFTRLRAYVKPFKLFTPFYVAFAFVAGAAGGLSLLLASFFFPGYFSSFWYESLCLALYLLQLAAFSFFLSVAFKKQENLVCGFPFLLFACLLFSPIIIDLTQYIPSSKALSAFLPTTFYLRAASGNINALWQLAIYILLTIAATLLMKKLRRKSSA